MKANVVGGAAPAGNAPGSAALESAAQGGHAAAARALLHDYHHRRAEIADSSLDEALGLPSGSWRLDAAADTAVQHRHPGESIVNVATPYAICRGLLDALSPSAGETVIDLGCGDGRVVLYGALLTPASFEGIELVAERAANGRRAIARLSLENAAVTEGNVLDHDFRHGDVFYLFRPFSVETESQVLAQLHQQATQRTITIAAHRIQPSMFDPRIFERVTTGALSIFRS